MTEEVIASISDEKLNDLERHARRDDWHELLVPSDIRQLIGDLRRARAHLPTDLSEERAREVLGPGVLHVTCDKRFVWHDDALRAMQEYAAGLQGEVERLKARLARDAEDAESWRGTMSIFEGNDRARTALGDTQ